MSGDDYESDVGSDISYLTDSDESNAGRKRDESDVEPSFWEHEAVQEAEVPVSIVREVPILETKPVKLKISNEVAFCVVLLIASLVCVIGLETSELLARRAALQKEFLGKEALAQKVVDRFAETAKNKSRGEAENDRLKKELSALLFHGDVEKWEEDVVMGEWKLIASMDASSYHSHNPDDDEEFVEAQKSGWFIMNEHFACHVITRKGADGKELRRHFFLDSDSELRGNVLVRTGPFQTVEMSLKYGRLQITERKDRVSWHRFYEKIQ